MITRDATARSQELPNDQVQSVVGALRQEHLSRIGLDCPIMKETRNGLTQRQVIPGRAVAVFELAPGFGSHTAQMEA
jgi:hypothetical protein